MGVQGMKLDQNKTTQKKIDTTSGPIDDREWPQQLDSHVVYPGTNPLIQGFDVQADLALHYSFAEIALLTLTGKAPDENTGRAFEIALAFLSPISTAEAPAHAAVLTNLMGCTSNGLLSVVGIGLVEQAHFILEAHKELLAWLNNPAEHSFPESSQLQNKEEHAAIKRLQFALKNTAVSSKSFENNPSLMAAILSVLYECGLQTQDQLEAVFTFARFLCTAAEGFAIKRMNILKYPMNLPVFRYIEREPRND